MEEFIATVLSNPVIRTFVEGLVIKVVADILHRRATDPAFLQKSDEAFAAMSNAKTDEDRLNAQKSIQSLLSG